MKDVQEMLEEIKSKKSLNQVQLAKLLGVNKSQVSRWLDGAVPKFYMVKKIKALYDKEIA